MTAASNTTQCPRCGCVTAVSQYGGDRGEAGFFLYCDDCGYEATPPHLLDDGTPIYNEPAVFDEAECEARGRADRVAGVNPMDGPYYAGLPLYAWERGQST